MSIAEEPTPVPPHEPAWCTTDHAQAWHPDDDHHRSDGIAVDADVRRTDGHPEARLVEVGLLQRRGDTQPWIVVEDGETNHLELTLESARRLLHRVRTDDVLRRALDEAAPPPGR